MLILRLLGTLSLHRPDRELASGRIAQPRRLALLAVLATEEAGCSREQLADLFWPESDPERALSNVADAIYVLRRELGDGVVRILGDRVTLDASQVRSDVASFLFHIRNGALAEAVEAYTGPFLDGFHLHGAPETFEKWVDGARRRLAFQWQEALEALAATAVAEGQPREAVAAWRRLTEADPFNTRYTIALMTALVAAGHSAEALRVGHGHEEILRSELDLASPPELLAAMAVIRDGGPNSSIGASPARPPAPADRTDTPPSGGEPTGALERAPPERSPAADDPSLPMPARRFRWVVGGTVLAGLIGVLVLAALGDSTDAADRLQVSSTPQEPGPEAWSEYLRAREIERRNAGAELQDSARIHFERAIRLAPGFALAHARLSLLHSRYHDEGWDVSLERNRLALHHARQALSLDPDLAEGHRALGLYYYRGPQRWDLALSEFDLAQRGVPDDVELIYFRALTYRRMGEWTISTRLLERVVELEADTGVGPRLPESVGGSGLGQVLYNYLALGRFDDMERAAEAFRIASPEDAFGPFWLALVPLVRDGDVARMEDLLLPLGDGRPRSLESYRFDVAWGTLVMMGRPVAALQAARALSPQTWVRAPTVRAPVRLLEARALQLLGEPERARVVFESVRTAIEDEIVANPEDPALRIALAHVLAGLGMHGGARAETTRAARLVSAEDAFRKHEYLLELAAAQTANGDREAALVTLREYLAIPSFIPLRNLKADPRFASIWMLPESESLVDRY